jgi:hypothetical protein
MAAEQFLSYHTYYLASFMYGLFMRRWAFPTVLLVLFWHYLIYGLIVGQDRFKDAEFHYWLPITSLLGITMGYLLSGLVNLRRVIFWKQFDLYGCWILVVLLEFTIFHGVFAIWETSGWVVRPASYLVTFAAFLVLIPLAYFFTSGSTVWAYWDNEKNKLSFADRAAVKFHSYWALYQLSGTLIFTVVQWSSPSVWPFWIALGTFVFHIAMWFLISLFIINDNTSAQQKYKKMRSELSAHISKVPGADNAFWFPWGSPSHKERSSVTAIEMELAEQGELLDRGAAAAAPAADAAGDAGKRSSYMGKLTDYAKASPKEK